MTSHRCTVAILALAFVAPFAARAQSSAPMGASTMAKPAADAASAGKAKHMPQARVSGGPGYVSEGATASGSSASMPGKKVRARVTGGPGGTAP